MTNKYYRQGFLGAGLVKKLITSKGKKGEMLMKLVRESKKISSPKFFKDKTINIKGIGKTKKEILQPEEYIDIQNMSNNQLKKQIQKFGYIVGTKNKKLADRATQTPLSQKIKTKVKNKKSRK
jgi:hypothetical protein